ncbi:MAG TPA: hypothetical protein VMC79_09640 [Rectinemataceae bacterium]|nr:hypothetical protein [Rectinemataceae bacterium]
MAARRTDDEGPLPGRMRARRSPLERMISGLVFGLGFGALAILRPEFGWAAFVAVFAGFIPFISGLRMLAAERASSPPRRRLNAAERAAEAERAVLTVAREQDGCVTPALIAVGSELSLEEAETVLQSMVTKGHASMHVREDGRIEYEFREFMSLPKP